MMNTVGIDIGGTKIAGAVVAPDGSVVASDRVPTPADGAAIVDAVVGMIRRLDSQHPILVAGIAAPGLIDADRRSVFFAPNVPWRGMDLHNEFQRSLPLVDIVLDNDANAAGWGEFRFGAGRGYQHVVTLTVGTGVGGAIIHAGSLVRGGHGAAAELGHVRLVHDGLACGCGARGCLEQYGSGRALLRIANEIADGGAGGAGLAAARHDRGALDGDAIATLVADGDPGALSAVARVGRAVGRGAATIAAVLDPELFVVGGGVAALGEPLLTAVRDGYLDALPARGHHPEARFATAELGNEAGVVGAADLARFDRRAAAA